MKHLLKGLMLVLMGNAALAAEAEHLMVDNAYVRGLPPTAVNTAAYMRLMNHGNQVLTLTGAASPVAESVSLHETVEEDGMMNMHHVGTAQIPVHGELRLESGGLHLMLMGLREPVAEGDTVEITLEFAGDLRKTLRLPVRSVRMERAGGGHHDH